MLAGSLLGAILFLGGGALPAVADVSGKSKPVPTAALTSKSQPGADPVEVQQNLLRFADEFSVRMTVGVEKLRRRTDALTPAEALQWKIAITTETCAIVTGPNAVANLMDMTVFVTALRMSLAEHAQLAAYGESLQPMFESCQSAEAEVWKLTAGVLLPNQLDELREALEVWHSKNPLPENVLAVRALGFATEVERASPKEKNRPGSVFGLLKLDPLAGMDPAVRELATTRLLAERALYLAQKMPQLLRWQLELLNANALASPTVQQLVTNTTQLTAAVERVTRVAELLPAQVSGERAEILSALQSQEKGLAGLATEVRQTLGTGTELSASLNTTLTSLDALLKRLGVGEPKPPGPPAPAGEPFRIQDYTALVTKLESTARQLTELITSLNQTVGPANLTRLSASVEPAVKVAQAGGKEVIDYAFWKGLQLVGVMLLAALVYRFLSGRLMPARRAKDNQP